jgi:hypothetical protein
MAAPPTRFPTASRVDAPWPEAFQTGFVATEVLLGQVEQECWPGNRARRAQYEALPRRERAEWLTRELAELIREVAEASLGQIRR